MVLDVLLIDNINLQTKIEVMSTFALIISYYYHQVKTRILAPSKFMEQKRSNSSLFLSASIWSPAFFIPHPAVSSDNITGRRPRLAENDKFKASG